MSQPSSRDDFRGNRGGPPRRGGRGRGRGGGGGGFSKFPRNPRFNQPRASEHEDSPNLQDEPPQQQGNQMFHSHGSTVDLPPEDPQEKPFNARNRLYLGGLHPETTEEDLAELFKSYGQIDQAFINKEKSFAFLKFDFHQNAVKARTELDGTQFKDRTLKIRFAPINTAVKVKNLGEFVTNELLKVGFQMFGEVEKATVLVDEKGKPTGEGIVDFVRKNHALTAVRRCSERCFYLTNSLRPCMVEMHEYYPEIEGYPERALTRHGPDFQNSRSRAPHFAHPNTFEHEYGTKWKQLIELYAEKTDALKKEFKMEEQKLEAQMNYAKYEYDTEMLRRELRARDLNSQRQKQEWGMQEKMFDDGRRPNLDMGDRQDNNSQDEMRRRDEEFMGQSQDRPQVDVNDVGTRRDPGEKWVGGSNSPWQDSGFMQKRMRFQ